MSQLYFFEAPASLKVFDPDFDAGNRVWFGVARFNVIALALGTTLLVSGVRDGVVSAVSMKSRLISPIVPTFLGGWDRSRKPMLRSQAFKSLERQAYL